MIHYLICPYIQIKNMQILNEMVFNYLPLLETEEYFEKFKRKITKLKDNCYTPQ